MPSDERCPCGSGDGYAHCCGPLHRDDLAAGTAIALMRSRFSAFAIGDADYLLATWHHATRPKTLRLDDTIIWRRLQIVDTEAGGASDEVGVVEFRAQYVTNGERRILHERSRFARTGDGTWRYLDGQVID
ncbi:YchJ family metal-binding protein [Mycolicibacterium septicum]|uniref:YchJ family protein n=1 Tax=Mycolicibacterium septicum TaxID=98668 RepID=UPI0023E32C93|nr:YchJ family metal-binding protein [Mycolicibacterium septicum]MDF3337109.1 YchJ family metal-binding protein [Mycolicibacterium septicum]